MRNEERLLTRGYGVYRLGEAVFWLVLSLKLEAESFSLLTLAWVWMIPFLFLFFPIEEGARHKADLEDSVHWLRATRAIRYVNYLKLPLAAFFALIAVGFYTFLSGGGHLGSRYPAFALGILLPLAPQLRGADRQYLIRSGNTALVFSFDLLFYAVLMALVVFPSSDLIPLTILHNVLMAVIGLMVLYAVCTEWMIRRTYPQLHFSIHALDYKEALTGAYDRFTYWSHVTSVLERLTLRVDLFIAGLIFGISAFNAEYASFMILSLVVTEVASLLPVRTPRTFKIVFAGMIAALGYLFRDSILIFISQNRFSAETLEWAARLLPAMFVSGVIAGVARVWTESLDHKVSAAKACSIAVFPWHILTVVLVYDSFQRYGYGGVAVVRLISAVLFLGLLFTLEVRSRK